MRLPLKHLRRRRGTVLAYLFLLIFGMLAITAMVTDVGFAILTRRQMLVASDSAALEGLRGRDQVIQEPIDQIATAGLTPDQIRRQRASWRVSEEFDDDYVFDHSPARLQQDRFQFGAGPVVQFSEGIPLQGTSFRASELLTVGPSPVYDPVLRLNLSNSVPGDMVSGTYLETNDPGLNVPLPPSVTLIRHVEQNDYTRDDFVPDGTQLATQLGVPPGQLGKAFLVRMRRTNEVFAPSSVENSAGPPLPYLFGRGTLLNPDAKARGITVRATSIADARRAMSVGLPYQGTDPLTGVAATLTGVTSFALLRSFWDGLSSEELLVDGGQLRRFTRVFDEKGNLTGVQLGDRVGQFVPPATSVGMIIGTPALGAGSSSGYVPIFQAVPTERVIGFGRATLTTGGTLFGYQLVVVTKQPSIVAPENASAVLTIPLDLVDTAELRNLLAAYESFNDPLLAPALVR